jgi:hypothetical protein
MELELDQFMEVYHRMLVKLMRKMEPQLSSLSTPGRSLHNPLSSECWRKKRHPHRHHAEVGEGWRPRSSSSSTKKDEIGSTNPQGRLETKSTNFPAARSPRGDAPTQILPANADTPHPSRLHTKLSATSY